MKLKVTHAFNIGLITDQLKEARKAGVEAAREPFAAEAKRITVDEDHVDSSRYVNSISVLTDFPATNKTGRGTIKPTGDDIVNIITETRDVTKLETGTAVHYAPHLERRYNIIGRGLDNAEADMHEAGAEGIIKVFSK